MNSRQGLTIVAVILLLLLLGVGYWGFRANSQKNALTEQNAELNTKLGDLTSLRDNLEREVDSLQQAYASLATENESLQGSIADAQEKIAQKEAAIRKISKQSTSESKNLKAQIEELLAVKNQLEASIQSLQSENDSLRTLTGQLTTDLASAKSENEALAALNSTIQEEVKRLTLANFKASAFRVEVEKKRPKATAKAGRARKIMVSFDLTDVKKEFRGLRPLYLVITDDKGTPISVSNPVKATVKVNNQAAEIIAVKQQDIDIVENQRLSFTHDLEEKLKSGYYRVAVYTDIGLLGASSFRLQ
jgi:DNA repair exonuclease SbcCD ATPase subunit